MIEKYSKINGVQSSSIKGCIESKKKAINNKTVKTNLRGNVKKKIRPNLAYNSHILHYIKKFN